MDENICSEPGCCNKCSRGTVLCPGHLYGFPQRASDEAIAWKMKQLRKDIEKRLEA